MCTKVSSFVILLLTITGLYGQEMGPVEEMTYYSSKYPDNLLIFKERSKVLDIRIVGDSIVAVATIHDEMFHLSDNTNRYATQKLYSSSFQQLENLNAYTLVPGKRKYQRIDVTEKQESSGKDSYVFYDDSREISLTFPSVHKGVKTVLEYEHRYSDPRMIGMFFFNTYLPLNVGRYQIVFDPGIKMKSHYLNEEKADIAHKEEVLSDGRIRWTFEVTELDKIKFDDGGPSYNYLAAGVYCSVASYHTDKGDTVELLDSPTSLHNWYRSFVGGILSDDPAVAELANSIVEEGDSEYERANKIFDWVQSNIKYIAFEDGMRGLIPHSGQYVIEKRYGDCKDMASAIVSLLRSLNIKAYYSWIGTRDLPYSYNEMPSPLVDNHMIATYESDGKIYFLDATGQYTPMGLPTSMIQGKECLVSKNDTTYDIVTVPVIRKEENLMLDSVYVQLDGGQLKGKGHVVLTGYAKVFNTYKMIKSNKKSVDDYVERLLSKGSNKFQMDRYELEHVDDLTRPIEIDYNFEIPGYYSVVGDQIFINTILDKSYVDVLIENRSIPLENEYKYVSRNVAVVDIPDDYELQKLPEDKRVDSDIFGYNITYRLEGSRLVTTKEFYLDYLLLDPASFDEWNEINRQYSKACRQSIVFTKVNNSTK